MRVAATQINIIFGDVQVNLQKALSLIHEAASQNAEVVVLPEFFTSGIAIHPIVDEIAFKNHECRVIEILLEQAQKHNILICGSLLSSRGTDTYNTIFIIEPCGNIFCHNKDIPTQFEHCYYTYGDTHRSHKIFGVAFCWEMLRSKTLREFDPHIQLVLAGSCWWGLPQTSKNEELKLYNQKLNRNTPKIFAKLAGLPLVHASLKGNTQGSRHLDDPTFVERPLIGTTQIINASGEVLKCIDDTDDDAVIVESILLAERINQPIPKEFWLLPLREEYLRAWDMENALGKQIYRAKRETHDHENS